VVLDWCCMSKRDGETINHLFLHCPAARDLWDLVFCLFGVDWVMPRGVLDMLSCWSRLSRRVNGAIWSMIPHCLLWCLWRERNARTFEGCEKSSQDLKLFFFRTLLEWVNVVGLLSCFSLLELIDNCSFAL
jgi:hypothetical protein